MVYFTNLYNYAENYNISYLYKKPKKFVVLSICKRLFSVNYVVMDASNIVLWVSVCEQIRNMNVKDFTFKVT